MEKDKDVHVFVFLSTERVIIRKQLFLWKHLPLVSHMMLRELGVNCCKCPPERKGLRHTQPHTQTRRHIEVKTYNHNNNLWRKRRAWSRKTKREKNPSACECRLCMQKLKSNLTAIREDMERNQGCKKETMT